MIKFLETAEKIVLSLTLFLLPLAYFPAFPNPYESPKLLLLVIGVSLALLLRSIKILLSSEAHWIRGSFDIPILVIALSYLLSAIFKTPNKMEAFVLPGTATWVLGGAILYFLINQFESHEKKYFELVLFVSGLTLSILYLLSVSKIIAMIPQLPVYAKDSLFSPIGGVLALAILLATLLPLGIGLVLKEKLAAKKALLVVSLAIVILSLLISISNMLPGKAANPQLPSWQSSWAIALESIKESPVLGIGPGNYLSAFSKFLPLSYNQTSLWAVRFTNASDFFLTSLSEVGLLGLAGFVLLVIFLARSLPRNIVTKDTKNLLESVPLILLLILYLVLPVTGVALVLLFVLASVAGKSETAALNLNLGRFVGIAVIVGLILLSIRAFKVTFAELTFKNSLDALALNDGLKTYNLMREAVNLNPNFDRYHLAYAQVNIALARNMSANLSKKDAKEISEADRNTISQLISQSIREGKAAVSLNPQRAGNWEVLARIYQAIIPLAQGADQFTVQTFTQAVALDPINPNLRIALGGVYYSLGNYDEAIDAFRLATLAKGDLANSHYNLAIAYREKGELEKAIAEIKVTLSLVIKDSEDEKLAKNELANLESRRAQKTSPDGTSNLVPPQPAQEQLIRPPLPLPDEATPPSPEQQ